MTPCRVSKLGRRFRRAPPGCTRRCVKNRRTLRHQGVGTTVAVCNDSPHRLQNRRDGGLPSPHAPQIRSSGCSVRVGAEGAGGVGLLRTGACGRLSAGWGLRAAGPRSGGEGTFGSACGIGATNAAGVRGPESPAAGSAVGIRGPESPRAGFHPARRGAGTGVAGAAAADDAGAAAAAGGAADLGAAAAAGGAGDVGSAACLGPAAGLGSVCVGGGTGVEGSDVWLAKAADGASSFSPVHSRNSPQEPQKVSVSALRPPQFRQTITGSPPPLGAAPVWRGTGLQPARADARGVAARGRARGRSELHFRAVRLSRSGEGPVSWERRTSREGPARSGVVAEAVGGDLHRHAERRGIDHLTVPDVEPDVMDIDPRVAVEDEVTRL
jgi:hypothetical protein